MSPARSPTVATVSCVHNEQRVLPAWLAYHRALGVSRMYFFLNRCTDRTRAILEAAPGAEVFEGTFDPDKQFFQAYQMNCADEALRRARGAGIDWLLHLDADEYAWGGDGWPEPRSWWRRRRPALEEGSLPALFARVKPETECVQFASAEAVPERRGHDDDFWALRHFQWKGTIERDVLDPLTGKTERLQRWMGHHMGKAAVRASCDAQCFNPHYWTRQQHKEVPDQVPLVTETRGVLFHFIVTGAGQWVEKYSRWEHEPDRWMRGGGPQFPRTVWKVLSHRLSPEEARAYYRQWVAVPPALIRRARRSGGVRRATAVKDVLRECGFLAGA